MLNMSKGYLALFAWNLIVVTDRKSKKKCNQTQKKKKNASRTKRTLDLCWKKQQALWSSRKTLVAPAGWLFEMFPPKKIPATLFHMAGTAAAECHNNCIQRSYSFQPKQE